MNLFWVAQFFGILVIISNVIAMQINNRKRILFCCVLANIFASINFYLLKSYSGAIICLFAVFQTIINNFFEKKEKDVPKLLIVIYIMISIILGSVTFNTYLDIMPIMCLILFTIMILQKKESNIRKIALINIILWIVYDFSCKAYTEGISDLITMIPIIIGIYRFDIKNKKS